MKSTPLFAISTAAELAGLHPQTLRNYERAGLLEPARTPGGTRKYSLADVDRARAVRATAQTYGMSLAGVRAAFDEQAPPQPIHTDQPLVAAGA